MKSEIAYVDDNQNNLDLIETVLEKDFNVSTFKNPEVFLAECCRTPLAAIMIDIHMPQMDGFALYEKILAHKAYNGCPILFISSDDSESARIKSLELGAVDFLSRHTRPLEMLARIKSRIQFFQSHRSVIEFEGIKLNLTLLKVYLNNQEIPLTFTELKLLKQVLSDYPEATSKEVLVRDIWKNSVLDATIHTHLFNLNSKLTNWKYEIQAEKGKGILLSLREHLK